MTAILLDARHRLPATAFATVVAFAGPLLIGELLVNDITGLAGTGAGVGDAAGVLLQLLPFGSSTGFALIGVLGWWACERG